jgi:hypothetical protein
VPETQVVASREQNKYYTYSDIFYVNRHSFFSAGQDSWTLPPAQNNDLFIALTNVEPVLQGILQRRRGYTLFSSQSPSTPYTLGYSFRSEQRSIREVVWTSTANVMATTEAGVNYLNPIFTPSTGALRPRMVLSRSYGYFADGISVDNQKWDGTTGTGNLTNWGIATGAGVAANSFSNYATAGSNNSSSGTVAWTGVANVTGPPDGNPATVSLTYIHLSNYLQATNYFSGSPIPSSAGNIVGIQVAIRGEVTGTGPSPTETDVFLIKNGVVLGSSYKTLALSGVYTTINLGGVNDLWGTTWLNTDLNATNFGVAIQTAAYSPSDNFTMNIDSIQVTVYTSGSSILFTTNTLTTNIVLLNGRTYFYAFQNSNTGHTGALSVPSASTGPLPGSEVDLTGIPVSTDPQVTTVLLLATADGNDQTTLYQVGTVSNGTTTFKDTMPDGTLLTQPLYLNTDVFGVIHGIANNNPPPGINFPTKHKGRIYGAVGQALLFSKNIAEVTTANGLITGKYEEAWPATNTFDISEQAETIQGLISDGETLWIGTERSIRRLVGDSPSNFQLPEIQFNEAGLLNQDCWKITFYEGQPVGTIWMTPDFRVMASDFNTYQDIGTPIQDVLNGINTAAVSTIHAAYVSKGPADYYMLYIPTGSNTTPDTICVLNLRSKLWFIWKPTDLITGSLFLIDVAGLPRWLMASQAGSLYEWTSGSFQDRIGNTPVSYAVTIQTAWMDFGDYNIRKFVNQIIPTTADNAALTIQVDAASNEQDFNSPLSVVPATVVIPAAIPDDVFVPLASGPSHSRAFRFTFVSPPSTIQNILTGFAIEAGAFHRY